MTDRPTGRRRPVGRRPGEQRTREQILDAAREQFAAHGYTAATMRRVAAAADVDPALLHHYFGTKYDLFAAAMQLPGEVRQAIGLLAAGDRADLGARLVRLYLGLWQHPASNRQLRALVASVLSHDQAARTLREALSAEVLGPLVAGAGGDRAALRATLAASHLVGLALARHVLAIEPLASADLEDLVRWVGPVVQHYLTGPLDPPGAPLG
ncbi:TetR family transcriptional regulator [Actinocatenispora thailandica]|uniref:TetR family transcriptional regulator n=1 Tax=Actinocatenispora thailandica TaxID=227318 RepID=A0A7R7HXX8_9ACTN|nr:TetR family transcriptional regulator [Actinocatenispora thailandica]BCJ36111.1 TetR family transcriptional regulator [Actinocatenispora thailandica]